MPSVLSMHACVSVCAHKTNVRVTSRVDSGQNVSGNHMEEKSLRWQACVSIGVLLYVFV